MPGPVDDVAGQKTGGLPRAEYKSDFVGAGAFLEIRPISGKIEVYFWRHRL